MDSLVIYQLYPSIDPFTAKIIELTSAQIEISKEIKNTSDEIYSNTRNNSIIFIFVGISFGILLSIYIISGIRKELTKLNEVVFEIAKCDLTFFIDASSNDEIGELSKNLKKMVVRLKQIVSVILAGSENIVKASTESSNTSLQISQGANQQAAWAEEASTSLDELSSMIQRNTSRLNETEQIAF